MVRDNDLISREAAINLIEGFQRELCPVGMFGRHAVYGSDRDKFDNWQFIIDELEKIPTVDAAPVVHGRWIQCEPDLPLECGACHCFFARLYPRNFCPHCGAKMDGGWA